MSLLINHYSKWAFVHIPKTGGTSITKVLLEDNNTEEVSVHDSLRMLDCDGTYFIFTVVRNPFTRICSAFEDEYRKGNTILIKKFHTSLDMKIMKMIVMKFLQN